MSKTIDGVNWELSYSIILIEIHNRLAEIAEGINDLAGYPKKLSPRFEYELKDKETLNFKLEEAAE